MFTPPKTNMDTQNNGLEKVTPFKTLQVFVSMLDFWGVVACQKYIAQIKFLNVNKTANRIWCIRWAGSANFIEGIYLKHEAL